MSKTSSHQRNADRWFGSTFRFAQSVPPPPAAPQAPSATPTPPAGPPGPPISGQTPNATSSAPKAVKTPITKENCKVTFDHRHINIEIPNQPAITLSLTSEQQAAVDARLSQDTFGSQGVANSQSAAPIQQ